MLGASAARQLASSACETPRYLAGSGTPAAELGGHAGQPRSDCPAPHARQLDGSNASHAACEENQTHVAGSVLQQRSSAPWSQPDVLDGSPPVLRNQPPAAAA